LVTPKLKLGLNFCSSCKPDLSTAQQSVIKLATSFLKVTPNAAA
jgi:hypothetical protein